MTEPTPAKYSPDYIISLWSLFKWPDEQSTSMDVSVSVLKKTTMTTPIESIRLIDTQWHQPNRLEILEITNTNRGYQLSGAFTFTGSREGRDKRTLGKILFTIKPEGIEVLAGENATEVFSLSQSYPLPYSGGVPKATRRYVLSGDGKVEVQLCFLRLFEDIFLNPPPGLEKSSA